MWLENFLEQEAIAVHSYEDACAIQKILIENGFCVMISREEHLWMINWVWTETPADRNGVVFISRENYEYEWDAFEKRHPEIEWEGGD